MLQQGNCVKRITASGGGDLTAPNGKSFLVKSIYCIASSSDTYLTISVDRVTVGFYRVKGRSGNHLAPMLVDYVNPNLMDFLTSKGVNVTIPIAEGQTLNVSRYAETGNVIIVYDIHDAGDIRADQENGSLSKTYSMIQYMSTSLTPTASESLLLDTSLSPSEYIDFPAGKVVPAGHKVILLGLVGHPFTTGAAGPFAWGTSFVKLVRDRETLFDEDRNGIPFDGQDASATSDAYECNFSLIGPCVPVLLDSSVQTIGDPLMFAPPIEFGEGEELNIFLTGVMTTEAAWEETMVDFACILKVVKT